MSARIAAVAVALAAILVATIVATTGGRGPEHPTASQPAPNASAAPPIGPLVGVVAGRLLQVGGPRNAPQNIPIAGYVAVYRNPAASGAPAAIVHDDRQGRFMLRVEPGDYYVVALNSDRDQMTGVTAVTVMAGRASDLRIRVSVP